jgi:hypothetical protein
MAEDVQNVRWKEFEDLGEVEVRKRLARHIWDEDKERLARQWLESKEWSRSSEDSRATVAIAKEANDLARSANDIARSNNIIATVALIFAVIAIAISIIGLFLKR